MIMIEMVAMESMLMIMMNYTNSYNLTHLGHVVANIGQIFTFMGHLTPFKIAACVARKKNLEAIKVFTPRQYSA